MAEKPKVLGLIPARGGSKRVPRKNLKTLAGKPLISWTIEAALKSNCLDDVIVSTEDEEIAQISQAIGAKVPFLRPYELATDKTTRNEVVRHVLEEIKGFDFLILLQPTSPLRTPQHIDEAFNKLVKLRCANCVSVKEQKPSHHHIFKLRNQDEIEPLIPIPKHSKRSTTDRTYILNGALYICEIKSFIESNYWDPFTSPDGCAYIMPEEDSLDIDYEWQWSVAETLVSKKLKDNEKQ